MPTTTRTAITPANTGSGRDITTLADLYQKPGAVARARWPRNESRSSRGPMTTSSAGRNTRVPSAANATTATPA